MNFKGADNVRASADIREEQQPYVLSQYGASPIIRSILGNIRPKTDAQKDLEGFYDTIFDLERVGEAGMDVWGNILNIARTFTDPLTDAKYTMYGDNYKLMLWLKALANISAADLSTFASLVKQAVGLVESTSIKAVYSGNYVTRATDEDGNYYNASSMKLYLSMDGTVNSEMAAVIAYLMPFILAAGVWYQWVVVDVDSCFGFNGSGLQPFNQGTFGGDMAVVARS